MKIKLPVFTCKRCGHKWHPRKERKPICCARCKSPYWDIEPMEKKNVVKKNIQV